jgi:UTP--glucose-1-phosphate uridylyltransferase
VLKLNGGLGTTMGCVGPKSAIEVREGMTFLDLTVRQMQHLNETYGSDVPLVLMNSFNTDKETRKIVQKYTKSSVNIVTFNQSRFPRIGKETLLPVANDPIDTKEAWYPPGHGDVYQALSHSGLLDDLIKSGIEYLFISNIDNLGATVDTAILKHMIGTQSEFLMEVTDKTRADIKGGTLIDYNGNIRLLEIAQVPSEHRGDFTSIKKFKIFNTNNIWVSVKAIKRLLETDAIDLEVIVNEKAMEKSGEKVIQLETAVGAAIKHFGNAHGINVPRSRFLPVKSCSDLFLIRSDLYFLEHGILKMSPKRQISSLPLVKLGDHFKKVSQFLSRFAGNVQIVELDHLTVTGDVTFGKGVVLKGTVIIVANHGSRIDIPAGSVLEDKVVSGGLHIVDH